MTSQLSAFNEYVTGTVICSERDPTMMFKYGKAGSGGSMTGAISRFEDGNQKTKMEGALGGCSQHEESTTHQTTSSVKNKHSNPRGYKDESAD